MAFQVLGLALWGTVGVIGAWLLVTGRHLFLGCQSGLGKDGRYAFSV